MRWSCLRKQYIAGMLLLIITILLSGCFDQHEVDELAYPMAMGLDIGEANKLRLTLQLAAPLSIGAGGGGNGGEKGGGRESSSIITVDTPSIYSGLNLINNIISKEITMSHAQVVVISRRLAEEGISKYLHAIQRGREFRPDIFIMVSNNPPDEYLRNVKPTLESSPEKYYELMLGKNFTSFYPNTRIHEFYYKNESSAVQPVAILTGLSKYSSIDQLMDPGKDKNNGEIRLEGEYEAGDIPIVADQKNEVMGAAVFKKGKMVGTLNGKESECQQMVTGNFKYSYITIPDPYDKNLIIVLDILQRKRPVIKADLVNGQAKVHISIDLEGDFTSIQSGRNYEDQPQIIEQAVEEMQKKAVMALMERTRDEFDSDICGIGRHVIRKFPTWDKWEQYGWFDQYKNVHFEVDVNMQIRRTGQMIKTIE